MRRTPANSLTNTFDSGRCFCFYSNEGHIDSYSLIGEVQTKHDKLLLYTGTHGSSEAIYNSIYFKSLNLESLKRQKINFLDRKVPRCHKTAHHKVKTKPKARKTSPVRPLSMCPPMASNRKKKEKGVSLHSKKLSLLFLKIKTKNKTNKNTPDLKGGCNTKTLLPFVEIKLLIILKL